MSAGMTATRAADRAAAFSASRTHQLPRRMASLHQNRSDFNWSNHSLFRRSLAHCHQVERSTQADEMPRHLVVLRGEEGSSDRERDQAREQPVCIRSKVVFRRITSAPGTDLKARPYREEPDCNE